ncbi:MAG TPA: hypothetical protein PK359_15220 [Burkholderiaceae bacterium]|nr:hypothetical protein [Burkholderiaceae bacterium]
MPASDADTHCPASTPLTFVSAPLPTFTNSPFPGLNALIEILKCLKKHGERLDSQIAEEIGIPLEAVRQHVAGLERTGDVIACNLTRFNNGMRTDAWLYRVSGYIPPAAPGRKARPAK